MKAVICDVCGKVVKDSDAMVMEIHKKFFDQSKLGSLDICPECKNKIYSCIADIEATKVKIPGLEDKKHEV